MTLLIMTERLLCSTSILTQLPIAAAWFNAAQIDAIAPPDKKLIVCETGTVATKTDKSAWYAGKSTTVCALIHIVRASATSALLLLLYHSTCIAHHVFITNCTVYAFSV
jgi:hypothetical protein